MWGRNPSRVGGNPKEPELPAIRTWYDDLADQAAIESVRTILEEFHDGPEPTDAEILKAVGEYADIDGLADLFHAIENGQWPPPVD